MLLTPRVSTSKKDPQNSGFVEQWTKKKEHKKVIPKNLYLQKFTFSHKAKVKPLWNLLESGRAPIDNRLKCNHKSHQA